MNRVGCFDPSAKFKPQWAYPTPDGFRDEIYQVPFTFTVPANGKTQSVDLPVQLDDDVPFIMRAILFPNCGIGDNPTLVRIRDSENNPMMEGLILAAGVYGLSGFQNFNAFGFPFEPEVTCAPGGTILFDLLPGSNGSVSQVALFFGAGLLLVFFAQLMGAAGNGLTVQLIDPGAANVPLSVAVVGGIHVQVTLQTNGASAIISTLQQVANIVNSTAASMALMGSFPQGVGAGATVATAVAQTPLVGGENGTTVTLNGTLVGVKRFPECL